jgi:hypothetical protein
VAYLLLISPGNQNKITHQYSEKLLKTSFGIVPNNIKTINPTKPDRNLNEGVQNLYSVSEIAHKPIEHQRD